MINFHVKTFVLVRSHLTTPSWPYLPQSPLHHRHIFLPHPQGKRPYTECPAVINDRHVSSHWICSHCWQMFVRWLCSRYLIDICQFKECAVTINDWQISIDGVSSRHCRLTDVASLNIKPSFTVRKRQFTVSSAISDDLQFRIDRYQVTCHWWLTKANLSRDQPSRLTLQGQLYHSFFFKI